jgi:hypothetical protein
MTYTNVAAGDPIFASTINDLILYGPAKPMCMLQQQTGQSITSTTDTILTYGAGSENFDDLNWHSTTVNTSRVTPTIAGRYKVTVRGAFAFNFAIAASNVYVAKNGTIYDRIPNIKHYNLATGGTNPLTSNTASTAGEMTTYVDMNGSTDYLESGILQTSNAGVAQTTNAAASGRSTFIVELERAT